MHVHSLQTRFACALVLLFAGCQSSSREAHLKREVDELSVKVDSLIDALEMQRDNDSLNIDETTLYLTPRDSNATIKTDIGYLTVRMDSFEDFGSGNRTVFRFGNPAAVTLRGMRARLEWRVLGPGGDSLFQDPVNYSFLEELKPGRLSPVAVLQDDVPASRMLGVRISKVRFRQWDFSAK